MSSRTGQVEHSQVAKFCASSVAAFFVQPEMLPQHMALSEVHDEIDSKREVMIAVIKGKLQRKESLRELFSIRWRMV